MLIYGLPLAVFAITALTVLRGSDRAWRWALGSLAVAWFSFTLVRNEGFDGEYYPEFAWRWSPVHESTLPLLGSQSLDVTSSDSEMSAAPRPPRAVLRLSPRVHGRNTEDLGATALPATLPVRLTGMLAHPKCCGRSPSVRHGLHSPTPTTACLLRSSGGKRNVSRVIRLTVGS
ncbi:MAG UNVERIFIED_CONTAM: hypothetical protein LVR18_37285 [Planctomycetaceae bacterium]